MQRPTNYETLLNEWDQAEALKTALQKLYISNHNAQTSPFLRLPAELRNDIYARLYESHGVEIRINRHPNLFQYAIEVRHAACSDIFSSTSQIQNSYNTAPDMTATHPILQKKPIDPMFWRYPSACPQWTLPTIKDGMIVPPSRAQQLQLVATTLVCKQMYLDTALLPFRYYTFSAEHLKWLTSWLNQRLLPEQRNAVARLKMRLELVAYQSWAYMRPVVEPGSLLVVDKPVVKMLRSFPHLKRLVLTDWQTWRNSSSLSVELVQEKVREASGLRDLVVERSEDRMYGGG